MRCARRGGRWVAGLGGGLLLLLLPVGCGGGGGTGGGGGGPSALGFVSVDPQHDSQDAPVDVVPRVTFDQVVDASTVSQVMVTLRAVPGGPVNGFVAVSGPTITFQPVQVLQHATTYELEIAGSVRAVGGGALGLPLVTRFTTVALAHGGLDPTFGSSGVALGPGMWVHAGALDTAGRILAVGGYSVTGPPTAFAVSRFLANGQVDASFGNQGRAVIHLLPVGGNTLASCVALDASGRILVAGTTGGDSGVIRLLSDGSLDTTFGSNGLTVLDLGTETNVNSLVLQPDGRILAAGDFGRTSGGFLARLSADGTVDATFGSGGSVVVTFAPTTNASVARGMALQSDGRIVIAGRSAQNAIGVARLLADGTPDTSFGGGSGWVTPNLYLTQQGGKVLVQPDGRIVVACTVPVALVRLLANGTLDGSFGAGGGTEPTATGIAFALARQSDGKLLLGSTHESTPAQPDGHFTLTRFDSSGNPDPTFGVGGVVHTVITAGVTDRIAELLVQPDGRIVAVGQGGAFVQARVVRYLP